MTLNDIRKRSGLLILVIGVAMLGFILTDLMNSGTSLFQKGQNILLKVDDHELSFTNFEKELEENINIKFLSSLGTVNITDAQRKQERDLLWETKIEDIVVGEKCSQAGIDVSKTELWDLVSGEVTGNQSSLFGYFFREQSETGEWIQYNPDLIRNWIEIGPDNPQWFRYLFFKQNELRERKLQKYYNAVKKGMFVTTQDAKFYYTNQTKSVSGNYVYLPSETSESDYIPSEKEINKYYKKNINSFKNQPNREITYFVFDLTPSKDDEKKILEELRTLILDRNFFNKRLNQEEVELGFMNSKDLPFFVNQYGDNEYKVSMFSKKDFSKISQTMDIVNGIINPYLDNNICRMGRIVHSDQDSVHIVYLDRILYASDQTLNEIYSEVFDFINTNKIILDTKEVSKKINNRPRKITFQKMDESVPGLGSAREIVRWAFDSETIMNETKFFDLQEKYVVAFLSKVSDNEFQNIEDVSDKISSALRKEHVSDNIINQINLKSFTSLEALAEEFDLEVNTINNLQLKSDNFGEAGYHPSVVGSFFAAKTNSLSPPIKVEDGIFILKKTVDGTVNYPSDFNRYKSIIETQQGSKINLELVDLFKSEKNIKDNRFNFY